MIGDVHRRPTRRLPRTLRDRIGHAIDARGAIARPIRKRSLSFDVWRNCRRAWSCAARSVGVDLMVAFLALFQRPNRELLRGRRNCWCAWSGIHSANRSRRRAALRCFAGVLIAMFGLHVAGWWSGIASVERAGLMVWRRVAPLTRRLGHPDRSWEIVALGMLWGWLPCGLVYSALAGAASTGRSKIGMAFMFCFGLGTLPALVPASALSSRLAQVLAARSARRLAGVVLLCFGIWSVAGAIMPLVGTSAHSMHHSMHDS